LADGKMPGGFENGDAFSEMAAALGLPLDVDETQDAFIYTADVPGLEKGDLKVTPRRCGLRKCCMLLQVVAAGSVPARCVPA